MALKRRGAITSGAVTGAATAVLDGEAESHATAAPSRAPRPILPDDLGGILDGFNIVTPTDALPEVECMSIDFQGRKGGGKSTAMAGNPRAIIAKLTDGAAIIPNARAKVVHVRSLDEFEKLKATVLQYAAQHGTGGRYCTFGVDPTSVLINWVLMDVLRQTNEEFLKDFERRKRYNQVRDDETPTVIRMLSKLPKVNESILPDIGRQMGIIGDQFRAYGWGYWTCTHYKYGYGADEDQQGNRTKLGGGWRPNIPASCASYIANSADICVKVERTVIRVEGQRDSLIFQASFSDEKGPELVSRFPLRGGVVFRDIFDDETPADYCPYDDLRVAIETAKQEYIARQKQFVAATGT